MRDKSSYTDTTETLFYWKNLKYISTSLQPGEHLSNWRSAKTGFSAAVGILGNTLFCSLLKKSNITVITHQH